MKSVKDKIYNYNSRFLQDIVAIKYQLMERSIYNFIEELAICIMKISVKKKKFHFHLLFGFVAIYTWRTSEVFAAITGWFILFERF